MDEELCRGKRIPRSARVSELHSLLRPMIAGGTPLHWPKTHIPISEGTDNYA